jgi:hypothetical protein
MRKILYAIALLTQQVCAGVMEIKSAQDIETYVLGIGHSPQQVLVFQDLDRCAFYQRALDKDGPDGKKIFEDGRAITEAETDTKLRDPNFKNVMDRLKDEGYRFMAVTGRPPAIDTVIAQWCVKQKLIASERDYLDAHYKVRDPLKDQYLKVHADQLTSLAEDKAKAMETASGLKFTGQSGLTGSFSKPDSGSAYYDGVAYTGYDKGGNILWYLEQLGIIKDGKSSVSDIVVVDDDTRSIGSYQKFEAQFKAVGITLRYLHWAIPEVGKIPA